MIDIDYFKQVNDLHGHEAGDEALQSIARLLLANVRSTDIICRYGGEEILCLLTNTTRSNTLKRAEDLRQAIADLQPLPYHPTTRLTVSIGATMLSADTSGAAQLLKAADEALYQAKASGRNCVRMVG